MTNRMTFDDEFPAETVKYTPRFDSAGYNKHREAGVRVPAPVSPCHSEASSASSAAHSITGAFSNIGQKYYMDKRVLGTGRHGVVRECVDRATGRRCAAKSIRKGYPSVTLNHIAREIALLKEMKHDNIVRLVDVYEDAECVHLVTDLCEGGELFQRIAEKSEEESGAACFEEDEAARIMHQILKAVLYLHEQDVVHRDLKPENVLFETAEEGSPVKIVDFGLSRKHRAGWDPPMGTVAGTPYYVAPEVLRQRYDKSCDLWSVGVIAYMLLCCYPPFMGDDDGEVHAAVLKGKYRFPPADFSGASGEALDFIRRLLRINPRKRMTAEQALNHPWIVQWGGNPDTDVTTNNVQDRQDASSVDVLPKGISTRDSIQRHVHRRRRHTQHGRVRAKSADYPPRSPIFLVHEDDDEFDRLWFNARRSARAYAPSSIPRRGERIHSQQGKGRRSSVDCLPSSPMRNSVAHGHGRRATADCPTGSPISNNHTAENKSEENGTRLRSRTPGEVKKKRRQKSSKSKNAEAGNRRTFLPHLDLGDVGRERDMMPFEFNSRSIASDMMDSLGVHDFAFVLRSGGRWTYAIIADKRDDVLRFVVDGDGKTISLWKEHWSTLIRLVNPNEARSNNIATRKFSKQSKRRSVI